jgi:hypothetical protein
MGDDEFDDFDFTEQAQIFEQASKTAVQRPPVQSAGVLAAPPTPPPQPLASLSSKADISKIMKLSSGALQDVTRKQAAEANRIAAEKEAAKKAEPAPVVLMQGPSLNLSAMDEEAEEETSSEEEEAEVAVRHSIDVTKSMQTASFATKEGEEIEIETERAPLVPHPAPADVTAPAAQAPRAVDEFDSHSEVWEQQTALRLQEAAVAEKAAADDGPLAAGALRKREGWGTPISLSEAVGAATLSASVRRPLTPQWLMRWGNAGWSVSGGADGGAAGAAAAVHHPTGEAALVHGLLQQSRAARGSGGDSLRQRDLRHQVRRVGVG